MTKGPFASCFAIAVGVIAGVAFAACHPAKSAAPALAELGQTIGDSTAFGARILRFDLDRHRAAYRLTAPAYVVLLVVTPAQSIEIAVGSTMTPTRENAGTHTADVRLPSEAGPRAASAGVLGEDVPVNQRVEFERCVAAGIRAATPRPTPPSKVKYDSLMRPMDPPPSREPPPEPEAGVTQRVEASCQRQIERQNSARTGAQPRGDRERYLVLLASDVPVGIKQLAELEVTEGDIQSIVAMIAKRLYADRQAAWSGYYFRW